MNAKPIKNPSKIVFFRELGFRVASNKKMIAIKNPKYALNLQLIKYQELIINMMKPIVSDKLKNIVQIY